MALLPEPRLRVTTAAGVPVSGGKLRLYDANTTNLTSVFTDAGLTTPLTNPIVAASDGYLPQFFAIEGTTVDGAFLTAADVEITGQAFVDAVFVGQNTGTIERDFTNSRLKMSGAAGEVNFEAGDPSPDNVGGTLRLGGWAGTQGDALELDFAAINTTGTLTENSKKLIGIVHTPATVVAAASTINIALPNTPTGTRRYTIELYDIVLSSSGRNITCKFSYDNAATFKAGAADYKGTLVTFKTAAVTPSLGADATGIQLCTDLATPTDRAAFATLDIITVNSGSGQTILRCELEGFDSAGTPLSQFFRTTGFGIGGYGRATHIQLAASLGTIALAYVVKTLRGYGE